MSKRIVEFFILDIFLALDRIKRYSKHLYEANDFIKDEAACSAIMRELGIVGEAMNYVLKSKKLHDFVKPLWRDIVDFRNIVIHEYFGLGYNEVFKIIKREIPALEQEMLAFIKNFKDCRELYIAIKDTKEELQKMGRLESLKYIKSLEQNLNKNLVKKVESQKKSQLSKLKKKAFSALSIKTKGIKFKR